MSLIDKILKTTSVKLASAITDSKVFGQATETKTQLPILNVAFSGSIKGGFKSGLIQFAGESRCFKSNLGLLCVAAYLRQNPEGICVFYDSEHGTPPSYLESFGIDCARVVHIPITNVEMLKIDFTNQLEALDRGDKVVFFIDSIGNLASNKEVQDALDAKTVGDMSRAKAIKSLWRIATPLLSEKDITCFAINHVYQTQEMFSKTVIGGGTGNTYSSNTMFIITRSQEKNAEGLKGYKFTINIEKSRGIRDKAKLFFTADFEDGIDPFSGLLDMAVDFGIVVKPKNGWYTRPSVVDDKNWRADATSCAEFWKPIFDGGEFETLINNKYRLGEAVHADHKFTELDDLI